MVHDLLSILSYGDYVCPLLASVLNKYFSVSQDIDGKGIALSKFKGKALLIVNVASQW
jgi:hypothetical protein